MPAIYALYIADAIKHRDNVETAINIGVDVLAVLLALPTDGESVSVSVFLSQAGAAIAIADAMVQTNKQFFTPSDLEAWNNFRIIAGIADISISQLSKLEAVQKGWATFSEYANDASENASTGLKSVWSSVKSLTTKEVATGGGTLDKDR